MLEEYQYEFIDLGDGLVDGCLSKMLEWLERWLIYPTSRFVLALEALRSTIKEVVLSVGSGFVTNLMTVITLIVISRQIVATVELSAMTMSTSASCSHSRGSSACFATASSFGIGSRT